ncbi:helix-turn-helix domain-containing protein [Arthrobacter sp. SO3]|uniref:PucR family transcriptional regulator n=1 Tax=Arthrobacter sp. SO3 TaxID=1897057 RepID=UPI001CFFDE23|nr:hypothetical protein [Arthrobacter sp. SO3]
MEAGRRGAIQLAFGKRNGKPPFKLGFNQLAVFVRQSVGPLLSHDHEYGRNLAATLTTYLDLSQHHARTCAALHIHTNTLYQRLERITAPIGPGWKEPSRSLDVQLALHLNGLMISLSQATPASRHKAEDNGNPG